ncbi:Uncharacterized protein APZ42_007641 [Daphnia magna]|uniref:Uncharacterized protein n=1 Tax=Daphnia magna TaxID=35525 RepID=A0A164F686_9CRUS|nr:Uncharacterized protein APZ42_007641 [Daphnia magna]
MSYYRGCYRIDRVKESIDNVFCIDESIDCNPINCKPQLNSGRRIFHPEPRLDGPK